MAILKKAKDTAKKTIKKTAAAAKTTASKKAPAKKAIAKSKANLANPANPAISKEMTIGDAVNSHPETAFVMMKHGLHCVGCHVAAWETIEQGAMGHGMDDKGIKTMVDEMNKAVEMMNKKK